jgi:uncharacterized protein (TIGR03643 family)
MHFSTSITAKFNLFPIAFPFFSPIKRALTVQTDFFWQMLFFYTFHVVKTILILTCLFNMRQKLASEEINRIIEMAWEDRTTFDAIKMQFGISEKEVIELMRNELKPSSWRLWRERVQGRATKHLAKRTFSEGRHKCTRQRTISNNKISKR